MANTATYGRETTTADSDGLPEGWGAAPLGQLISPSNEKIEPSLCPNAPYLSLEHIESGTNRIESQGRASDVRSTKAVFFAGDILYGKLRPYLNKVTIPDFDGVCSTDILVFRPTEIVSQQYMLRFLSQSSFVQYATDHQKGNSLPRVSFGDLAKYPMPLPPLAEQKRIVAKVEALLVRVNKARERLDRVPGILKKFRQSVLAAACSGRLTDDWREENPNFESAEVIVDVVQGLRTAKRICEFPPIVKRRGDLPKIPDSWCWTTFGFLMKDLQNGISTKPNLHPPGVPILRISALRIGSVFLDDYRFLEATDDLVERYALVDGDLLFTRYNGSLDLLGVCGMVRGVGESIILHPDKLMRVRFDHDYVDKEYVELFFGTPFARDQMTAKSKSSAGQQGVSGKDVKQQLVALPPKIEQQEIVRRVRNLIGAMNEVGDHVAVASSRSESITQSVLAKAFAGELVETEADLARREGRGYEPASMLLARIAALRPVSENGKPTRKKPANAGIK